MNKKNKRLLAKMNNEKRRSSLEKIKRKKRRELIFIVTLFLIVIAVFTLLFSNYLKLKTIDIDVIYYPKTNGKLTNAEILENLENLDNALEIEGRKVLQVLDRFLTLRNTDIKIVDRVGHYVFSLSLYDLYGKTVDYELIKDLKLRF